MTPCQSHKIKVNSTCHLSFKPIVFYESIRKGIFGKKITQRREVTTPVGLKKYLVHRFELQDPRDRGDKQCKNEMRIFIAQWSHWDFVIYFKNQTNPNQYCMTKTVIPRHESCVLLREIIQIKAIIKEIRE